LREPREFSSCAKLGLSYLEKLSLSSHSEARLLAFFKSYNFLFEEAMPLTFHA